MSKTDPPSDIDKDRIDVFKAYSFYIDSLRHWFCNNHARGLNGKDKKILLLRFALGRKKPLPVKEIAQRLNVKTGTIHNRISKSLRLLRWSFVHYQYMEKTWEQHNVKSQPSI